MSENGKNLTVLSSRILCFPETLFSVKIRKSGISKLLLSPINEMYTL